MGMTTFMLAVGGTSLADLLMTRAQNRGAQRRGSGGDGSVEFQQL